MQVLSIILAILAFGVLVIVHEFGHFITAKRGGVQVNEFWIGMGPTILKHEYHGTMYCLKLLPVGGACVMEGEDGESESEHAFGRACLRRRILIVAAGALMNFLIGFVILLFAVQAPTDNGFITTTVASISEGSSVLEGGLQEGDTIISIDGFRLLVRSDLNVAMGMSSSTTHSVKVRRGGETVELPSVPFEARIDDGATCGPRAYLRPATHLCEGAKAGTHVEIKKSTVCKGSKVPHPSYIGDTTIARAVCGADRAR